MVPWRVGHSFSMHFYTVPYGALGGWALIYHASLYGAKRYPGGHWAVAFQAFLHGSIWRPGGLGTNLHCIFTRCQAVPWGGGGRGIHFPCIFTRCHMMPWGVGHSFAMHFYTVPGGTLGGIGHSFPCIFTRCHMVPWGLGTHSPCMFTRC